MSWSSGLARMNTAVRNTFGVTVSWTHGSIATDIMVVPLESNPKEESTSPNYWGCWLLLSDAASIERGDTIQVDSTLYRVLDVDPDGGGGAYVSGEKTAA